MIEFIIITFVFFISVFADAKRDKIMPDLFINREIKKDFLWWFWSETQIEWHIYKWLSMFSLWIFLSYKFIELLGGFNFINIFTFFWLSLICRTIWKFVYSEK